MSFIALDAMGGDHGVCVVVPAALESLARHPDLMLILVGDEPMIRGEMAKLGHTEHARVKIKHTSEVVNMDESPAHALRNKKDSSMRVAINLVKQGEASACVSAGNTGALMATARFVLKTLPGIDRPAILAEIPSRGCKTRVLDLGANLESSVEHLCQFAQMGSVLISSVDGVDRPRVGLLNVGEEEIKGNEIVKQTAEALSQDKAINYIGYVEGDDIFLGDAELVVCDGFVGNVALKSCEGTAKLIGHYMKAAFNQNCFTRLLGILAWPVLNRLKKRLDPARYNGASLIGLNGIVVKSHGGANIVAFRYAIEEAIAEVKHNVPQRIRER